MIFRILGGGLGLSLILTVFLLKGLPVAFFLRVIPEFAIIAIGLAFLYAAFSKD